MKQAPARAPVVHLPRWLGELSPNPSCLLGGAVLSFVLTRFLTRTGAHPASSAGAGFRWKTLPPLPDIDKMPGDRGGRRHGGRHQMGAALKPLAAFEIAVRC